MISIITNSCLNRPAVIPKIECSDFDGGARRPIVELERGAWTPYGIALTRNYIFWSDWKRFVLIQKRTLL